MPTNLLHHGSQNRIQKTSRNMAARKGPRLYDCSHVASAAFSAAKDHFAWQAQHLEHVMIFLCGQRSIFSS